MLCGFQFQIKSIHRAKRDSRKDGRGAPRSSSRRKSPKKKRRNDPFSLYGSYGDDGSGSGSGPGDEDEIPRGAQLWLNEIDKYYFKHLNKVSSQLVEGRLRKPFMTGYW